MKKIVVKLSNEDICQLACCNCVHSVYKDNKICGCSYYQEEFCCKIRRIQELLFDKIMKIEE